MAIDALITATAAIGAYNSQAQANDAQNNRKNPLSGLPGSKDSSSTQLSLFGQVKLSLEDLQAKASALQNFSKPPTLTDFKVAVQGFVQSFNAISSSVAESAAKAAARQEAKSEAARNEQVRAAQSVAELRKTADSTSGAMQALRDFGIERQPNGSFGINQQQFDQSFNAAPKEAVSAFAEVADRVGKAIDKQLSSIGTIGNKVSDLSAPPASSEPSANDAQVKLDAQKNYQQRLAAQLASAGSYVARNAVVTYLRVSDF